MYNILFVCMGNICRSPTAEGFFAHHLAGSNYQQQVSIDSAGVHGYHVGDPPDPRAIEAAADHGIEIGHLRARKVTAGDFIRNDLIVAMDHGNFANLKALQPAGSRAQLKMMMSWHPEGQPLEVPDPYYGGADGFAYMCGLLDVATMALLRDLERQLGH